MSPSTSRPQDAFHVDRRRHVDSARVEPSQPLVQTECPGQLSFFDADPPALALRLLPEPPEAA